MSILYGDSLEVVPKLPQQYHAVITSPPYWGKLDYGLGDDQLGLESHPRDYLRNLGAILEKCQQKTLPGGALILNIGDTWNNYSPIRGRLSEAKGSHVGDRRRAIVEDYYERSLLDIPSLLVPYARLAGWYLRDRWVWLKPRVRPVNSDRPDNDTETVLYFRKPGYGRHKVASRYWKGQWVRSRVLRYNPESSPDHPCPMPLPMAQDIRATVPSGGFALDPFSGTNTVYRAAMSTGREATCIDLKDYSKAA